MTTRLVTIVETPEFMRRAKVAGLSDDVRTRLIDLLAADPKSGTELGGGLWKLRVARSGGGKSGGYRVVYFFRIEALPVFLLTVFAKNERANISAREQADLVALCDLIAREYGSGQ